MTRILQAVTVAAVVGLSAPAWACSAHGHGSIGVSLGSLFFGFQVASVPCSLPVVAVPQVAYAPPPVYVAPPPPVYVAPPPPVYVTPRRPSPTRRRPWWSPRRRRR
jgi:hypothetical protein